MSPALSWLALAAALVAALGGALYLGTMVVVQIYLRPVFLQLGRAQLGLVFAAPIRTATRLLVVLFIPFLAAGLILWWLAWGRGWLTALAALLTLVYLFLAIWFSAAMRPINQRLINGDVADDREVHELMRRWVARNWARFYASIIYWLASAGFLLAGRELWEGLW